MTMCTLKTLFLYQLAMHTQLEQINLQLFSVFNAGPGLHGALLYLAIFIAKYLIILIVAGLTLGWILGKSEYRSTLALSIFCACIGLAINRLISCFWFHDRPFVLHIGNTYLKHAPTNSFPSDHVTILWAIALCFLFRKNFNLLGLCLAVCAILIGWSRVFLGIHFPFDILGAMIISTLLVIEARMFETVLNKFLFSPAEQIYLKLFNCTLTKNKTN